MSSVEPGHSEEPIPFIQIPDHQLLRCIGHGSYGDVWLGRNMTGAYRAIKVIWRKHFSDQRPFERELAGITRFDPISRSHEGFVDVLHIGRNEEAGYFYYIMELADDCTTGQDINPALYQPKTLTQVATANAPRLPLEDCLQLGLSLSNALSHLHKRGLVHRDIKPANIIFVNGLPKLADIGLVASIKDPPSYVGTEGFFPPDGPGTPQADIFSLGKVLYEISMGQDRKAFPRLPAELGNWPERERFLELNEVLVRACQDDVRKRYQTAEEMHSDLTFLLNGRSVKRLRLAERRFASLVKIMVLGTIVLVAVGLAYFEWNRERKLQDEYRSRQIGSHMANGIRTMEDGNLLQALPSFVDTMRLDGKRKEAAHRVRIGLVLEQCPKLLQMWLHPDEISDSRFSPDGRLAVVCTRTKQVQVRDVQTGDPLSPAFGPRWGQLESSSFSPDGRWVLLAGTQKTASLWDWRTGERRLAIPHARGVTEATFNPAGDRILTACADNVARVWDLKGKLLFSLTNHTDAIRSARYSPDGKSIITTSQDKSALIWNALDGRLSGPRLLHKHWVFHGSFSPDGRRVITACFDNGAHVWDVATGQEVFPPLLHLDGVSSAEFSPDGRLILTGCWDGTARIWDAATGRPASPNPILPHSSRVLRASFHPDGHRIITACLDGTSRVWDLAGGSISAPKIHASFSLDGKRFLIQSNGWVQVADSRTKQTFSRISLPSALKEAALSDEGSFVLMRCGSFQPGAGEIADQLTISDALTGTTFYRFSNFTNSLRRTVLSKEGHWLASYETNLVWLHDIRSAKPISSCLPHRKIVTGIYISPTESELLTISEKQALLWDLKQRKVRYPFEHPARVNSARFSQDAKWIVTCCADQWFTECAAYVWDPTSGRPVGRPLQHRDGVTHASFAPDNKQVVTAGEDFVGLLWNLGSSTKPKKLFHHHQVHDGCFDQSGSQVLTVSRDQTARLWDAESGEPLGPPFPHPCSLSRGVFISGEDFLTFSKQGDAWLWKVKPNLFPIEDLTLLAQVLNGTLENNNEERSSKSLFLAWRDLKAKYPEQFTTTNQELLAWHRQQGELSLGDGQWAAALFHFDRFLALEPQEASIIQLRLKAQQQLSDSRETARSHP